MADVALHLEQRVHRAEGSRGPHHAEEACWSSTRQDPLFERLPPAVPLSIRIARRLIDRTLGAGSRRSDLDFESLVNAYYRSLYQFALSLTRTEADAADMTQQTFCLWAAKGYQLRDGSKARKWLFRTLHREFLRARRKERRFPHHELDEVLMELPSCDPKTADHIDAMRALRALERLPTPYRAPLTLFYLGEHSYKEVAEILDIPVGTVQSRIARGKTQLQRMLTAHAAELAESRLELG